MKAAVHGRIIKHLSPRAESVRRRPVERRAAAIYGWKRCLDLTLIVATLPLWLPLMILVMLFVQAVSAGPVFYRQERVGYRRRKFLLYKFRSMKVNADTTSHECYFERLMKCDAPMAKLDAADDRIIPGGRI